jgi:hypothetical protein
VQGLQWRRQLGKESWAEAGSCNPPSNQNLTDAKEDDNDNYYRKRGWPTCGRSGAEKKKEKRRKETYSSLISHGLSMGKDQRGHLTGPETKSPSSSSF